MPFFGEATPYLAPQVKSDVKAGRMLFVLLDLEPYASAPSSICLACFPRWRKIHQMSMKAHQNSRRIIDYEIEGDDYEAASRAHCIEAVYWGKGSEVRILSP